MLLDNCLSTDKTCVVNAIFAYKKKYKCDFVAQNYPNSKFKNILLLVFCYNSLLCTALQPKSEDAIFATNVNSKNTAVL